MSAILSSPLLFILRHSLCKGSLFHFSKDPQMAIPKGTLLAILITGLVYIGVAISAGKLPQNCISFWLLLYYWLTCIMYWLICWKVLASCGMLQEWRVTWLSVALTALTRPVSSTMTSLPVDLQLKEESLLASSAFTMISRYIINSRRGLFYIITLFQILVSFISWGIMQKLFHLAYSRDSGQIKHFIVM